MSGMDWIAGKHFVLVHLPTAAALLIPLPIMAALRGGRGMRPWWNTCRYLAWAGLLGSLAAALTGFLLGKVHGILPPGALWGSAEPGLNYLFRIHEVAAFGSLGLSVGCLRSLYRKRQEHQGIGVTALLLGLAWCATALVTSYTGSILAGRTTATPLFLAPPQMLREPAPAPAPTPQVQQAPAPAPVQDPESAAPWRALDFAGLKAMHAEPMKSAAHGNRWIRVWVTPGAAQAYQAGLPLPAGTLVVMNTLEDRWGRPGFEQGPIYALEIGADNKPSLTFYWPQVPETRRAEVGGASKVYWRHDDAGLKACMGCHAQGLAAIKDRSRLGLPIPRKPKAEAPSAE